MQTTKVTDGGHVYARTEYENGAVVKEKVDPMFAHDAPTVVPVGALVTVTFAMRDFDGATRGDSGGTLHISVSGTDVDVPVENGAAVLVLELHASVAIEQRAPYFGGARFAPFEIEVAL